ncbi:hypothetical protein Pmar_PMAR027222 [Perkinsus marinus ATCC 50983]|uniref:Uncharacterized protein n=1 Tax=Perkinsus marinus (strain ATCC 50983 / TXsc) TaxID=423536 RepID=C5LWW0_PERM5|nr:hypothetical protein Pmar_PMAR027222 [Perkinsus marinus ATCC 50983]EEQ98738.1 hypothetical protein Pmar_PMAR027222 [Perkinsus marinus ATCC 50983]|eukprot:XP_002766021.1 hypothetical protein Pmar_PMAR027222 [Perkinsus marinus ATCC 50983]
MIEESFLSLYGLTVTACQGCPLSQSLYAYVLGDVDPEEHWPPGNRAGDLQLPSELNRKLFVYNSRHTCGRKRSTVLMVTQGDRHKPILTLNREEFEGVMAAREEAEREIVNFGKKL